MKDRFSNTFKSSRPGAPNLLLYAPLLTLAMLQSLSTCPISTNAKMEIETTNKKVNGYYLYYKNESPKVSASL